MIRRLLPALLLVALASGVYINTLHAPFIFDDEALVERPITASYSQAIYRSSLNRKITFVSFAFSRALSGWQTWGWHLPNILLHAGVCILVWRWLIALGFFPVVWCWIAAALFAVHPVQTMSVTYIYQRSTLLVAFFVIASAICHIHALRNKDNRWLAGTLALAGLAALSKETALSAPFLLLLQEKILSGQKAPIGKKTLSHGTSPADPRDRIRRAVVFALAAAYAGLLAARIIQVGGVDRIYPVPANLDVSWIQHVMTQVMVWPLYLLRWIWPFYQNADPDIRFVLHLLDGRWIGSGFVLVGLCALAWKARSKNPALLFGFVWFVIALLPELFGIRDPFFEHRAYLANAGLAIIVCGVFVRPANVKTIAAAAVVLALLAGQTIVRNRVWNSQIIFWKDVVQKSPHKARGYLNLGAGYDGVGDLKKAGEQFGRVLAMGPDSSRVKALSNLGMIAVREGRYHEGLSRMRTATRMSPGYQRHFFFVGLAMEKIGQPRAAYIWYRRAATIRDAESCFQWQSANNLANLLLRQKHFDEADRWIRKGLDLRPGDKFLLLNQRTLAELRGSSA